MVVKYNFLGDFPLELRVLSVRHVLGALTR